MHFSSSAQDYLDFALDALKLADDGFKPLLDALPVPVYVVDAEGLVTYWNKACIAFAGREPELGRDRWCVTWKIYTPSDEHLPHDRCPMAVAIREGREVRSEVAIAMRPDGSRKAFIPYPTPLFDDQGKLTGAINLLIDVSDKQATALKEQAERCNRLAAAICDREVAETLRAMARGYENNAAALRASNPV
jgi:PAS domain S-box-containing protein